MKKVILFCLVMSTLWSNNYEQAVKEAQKSQKMLLVELVMEYCSYCEKMDKYVLSNEEVKQVMKEHYIFIKLDINKDEIPEHLASRVTPTFYFLNKNGDKVMQEIIGAPSKSQFLSYLNSQYKNMEN